MARLRPLSDVSCSQAGSALSRIKSIPNVNFLRMEGCLAKCYLNPSGKYNPFRERIAQRTEEEKRNFPARMP
jgi:hypothetical protein